MPFLDKQVNIINSELRQLLLNSEKFANSRIEGLAKTTVKTDSEAGEVRFPYVMNEHGEPVDVIIDDTYSLMMYHRRAGSSTITESVDSFGSSVEYIEQQPMSLIAFGKGSALKLTAEQFETFCILALPDEISRTLLTGIQIDKLQIAITGTDMDSISVFSQEYQGTDFPLDQTDFLIRINYTITSQFRKNCIDICDC